MIPGIASREQPRLARQPDYARTLYHTYTATTAPRIANVANTNRFDFSLV
ncbi:MAG TPA: hypothetical protein VFK57_11275 [Vicinamibacterales bacterium]|nr:hypothetical protein [Vicinamibacterales bacterium]